MNSFGRHISLALFLSYGLSLLFWTVLNVFNLPGFIIISALCAIAGAGIGYLWGRRLWLSLLMTFLIRMGVFFLMTGLSA